MYKEFLFHLPNDIGKLMQLAAEIRQLKEYGDLSPKTQYVLDLALEEMATNIIKYGYDEPGTRTIEISVGFNQKDLRLVLSDDGHEFNPLEAQAPAEAGIEERDIGGMGIYLTRNLVRSIEYERKENRNVLSICIDKE